MLSYKIVDCWLLYETDVERRSTNELRKVVFQESQASVEKQKNAWTYIEDAKAIRLCGGDEGFQYYVLKYENEATKLGNVVTESIRKSALAKLTEDEKKALGL